jgi:hypothetical protein
MCHRPLRRFVEILPGFPAVELPFVCGKVVKLFERTADNKREEARGER